ncbi:MAG: 8-amino-7-oxononanoate synthase [Alphaproteobacteria bacterium]|nr:8-amino-7-oxononanoate synthase [Alphaproteobacteria bacterium]
MSQSTPSLDAFARSKLNALEARNRRRRLAQSDNRPAMQVERDGQQLTNFCSNDYLGLSHHPEVIEAAQRAAQQYGAGAGASRLVTGGYGLLFELERRLAAFKGTEDSIVFGSGYLANLAITPALAGPDDLILIDELAHACLYAGAQLSGALTHRFAHNDLAMLRELLDTHRSAARNTLILTDGVFSMDGDLAPLPDMVALAQEYDAWLLVDDAHGLGVIGDGRGTAHHFNPPATAPLQMGTLSKAIGGYGGYLCASHQVCELLRSRARPLVFTTALPPASTAAALKALELIETGEIDTARPVELAKRFCAALDLPAPETPIVPVVLGSERNALDASQLLQANGFLVTAIRPPTVPVGTSRLRITFSATHRESDIDRLGQILLPLLERREAAE